MTATPQTVAVTTAVAKPTATEVHRRRVDKTFYVMLLPVVLLFTLFITVPAVVGMFYSITNYVGYGEWEFTGLTNYIAIFNDPRILRSYGFTLGFSVVTVIVVNIIALALALGLSAKIKLKTALRGVYFIPLVVSGIVIAYVFNYLFSTSLPTLASTLGIESLQNNILADERFAWIAIVVVTAWQAIPGEVYEAASIDGAKAWRQFRSITFPLVLGYVVINTILGFKGFLNAYDIIVGLTNGGPGTSTFSVAMTIFTGFTSGDYAYQMANAVIFFIVTVVISLLQLRLIQRRGVSL